MKPVTETRDERPALNFVRRTLNYLLTPPSRLRPPPWATPCYPLTTLAVAHTL